MFPMSLFMPGFVFHVLSHSYMDCREIVKAFTNAFLSKDPCSSAEQDYQLLLKLINQTIPCNTVTGSSSWLKAEAGSQRDDVTGPNFDQDEGREIIWT